MKSIKKMLLGIALILFGISLVCGGGDGATYLGWLISVIGLAVCLYFSEDKEGNK